MCVCVLARVRICECLEDIGRRVKREGGEYSEAKIEKKKKSSWPWSRTFLEMVPKLVLCFMCLCIRNDSVLMYLGHQACMVMALTPPMLGQHPHGRCW